MSGITFLDDQSISITKTPTPIKNQVAIFFIFFWWIRSKLVAGVWHVHMHVDCGPVTLTMFSMYPTCKYYPPTKVISRLYKSLSLKLLNQVNETSGAVIRHPRFKQMNIWGAPYSFKSKTNKNRTFQPKLDIPKSTPISN